MGHGGLHVLLLFCLLGVSSKRNDYDEAQCWTKGKGASIVPLQCPANFFGADAKLCCRLCFGANCCMPRRAPRKQDRCPRAARLAGAIHAHRTAPDVKPKDAPVTKNSWRHTGFALFLLILFLTFIFLKCCFLCCKWCWELLWNGCFREEQTQYGVKVQSSMATPPVPPTPNICPDLLLPPYEHPPPYSLVCPQGPDLPPAYPGKPVVASPRSRRRSSRRRNKAVVILPQLAAIPEALVTGRVPERAADPLETAASGGSPGMGDALEEAASGGALKLPEQNLQTLHEL